MNPDKQRIAIAAAVGTAKPVARDRIGGCFYEMGMRGPCKCDGDRLALIPDYLNDLNAMHAAEGALAEKDRIEYGNQLIAVCDRDMNKPGKRWAATTFYIIHATAAQRAEAFCRTLWPEKFES